MTEKTKKGAILALDIGSSSIRCTLYAVERGKETGVGGAASLKSLEPIPGCAASRKIQTVAPNTGHILLHTTITRDGQEETLNLLDEIDGVVDDALAQLRIIHNNDDKNDNDEKEEEEGNKNEVEYEIVGMGFSTFCMNLIALDAEGKPVDERATMTYACNSPQVTEECKWLESNLSPERLNQMYRQTGAPLHSGYALAQMRALYKQRESPSIETKREYSFVNRIVIWQTLSSLCLARWHGMRFAHISYSEASWTGLFNTLHCEWDKQATSLLPTTARIALPPVADFDDDVLNDFGPTFYKRQGEVPNPYWNRWPELQSSCRFFLGLGDGACANVGSQCHGWNRIAVTIGTSAAARVCIPLELTPAEYEDEFSDDDDDDDEDEDEKDEKDKKEDKDAPLYILTPGLFCYRVDKFHVLLGDALTDGGSVMEWVRTLFNLESDEEFDMLLHQVGSMLENDYNEICGQQANDASTATDEQEQDDNDKKTRKNNNQGVAVPFLSGERSTGFRNAANFCIMGMTRLSTRAHFIKACMESVMLRLRCIVSLIRQQEKQLREDKEQDESSVIVVSGTALERNALWRKMLADCTGISVQLNRVPEKTSLGCARMVAIAMQMKRDGSKNMDPYLKRLVLQQEEQDSAMRTLPRDLMDNLYWKKELEKQEELINAVSVLW